MTNMEIYKRISDLRECIRSEFQSNTFQFNHKINEYQEEILTLQEQCDHKFDENNICYNCGKRRKDD